MIVYRDGRGRVLDFVPKHARVLEVTSTALKVSAMVIVAITYPVWGHVLAGWQALKPPRVAY